ncbi:hypothetical protein PG993_009921 [Apiospora rasikravindrae]|uniref:Uncharacterized protein n=1 Tax=Apiospora rasikravindrae TaxID=990691 RepID=A0ABR1SM38_9PEZI
METWPALSRTRWATSSPALADGHDEVPLMDFHHRDPSVLVATIPGYVGELERAASAHMACSMGPDPIAI